MQLPEFITKMLDDIAVKEGFTNYKFELEAGSNHGDNYAGVMTSVKLIGDRVKNGAAVTETLHLICKVAPESKERREAFQTPFLFEREIEMYTHVLPTFVKFQQEKGLTAEESFFSFPKVYASIKDRVNEMHALIMDDLRSRDFVMWPRHDPVPLNHEKLLLTQLGRFHGVSLALKDQRPEVFAEFKKLNDPFTAIFELKGLDALFESTANRALAAAKDEKHKRLVQYVKENFLSMMKSSVTSEANERFGVINHGDCWINNFLFQYDANSKALTGISFLDWQISRYSSPALDVLYHIFSSTRKELRDQSYEDLLRIYHTALSETVRKLGSDPEKLFRYSDLKDELKAHGDFALVMAILLLAFVLAKPDDVHDMDDFAERLAKGEDVGLFKHKDKDSDVYIKVVNDAISDIIAYGYNLSIK